MTPPLAGTLAHPIHRTCEHCGTVQERRDDLHLCDCRDQMSLCRRCRPQCREDDECGEWWRAQPIGEAPVLKLRTVPSVRQLSLFD